MVPGNGSEYFYSSFWDVSVLLKIAEEVDASFVKRPVSHFTAHRALLHQTYQVAQAHTSLFMVIYIYIYTYSCFFPFFPPFISAFTSPINLSCLFVFHLFNLSIDISSFLFTCPSGCKLSEPN